MKKQGMLQLPREMRDFMCTRFKEGTWCQLPGKKHIKLRHTMSSTTIITSFTPSDRRAFANTINKILRVEAVYA